MCSSLFADPLDRFFFIGLYFFDIGFIDWTVSLQHQLLQIFTETATYKKICFSNNNNKQLQHLMPVKLLSLEIIFPQFSIMNISNDVTIENKACIPILAKVSISLLKTLLNNAYKPPEPVICLEGT